MSKFAFSKYPSRNELAKIRRLIAALLFVLVSAPAMATTPEESPTQAEILSGLALNVREQLGRDFQTTLAKHATTMVQKKFADLSANIWNVYPPETGWSYFASVSLPIVARADENNPIIAYYHPWSDVFLVTLWEVGDESVQMINLSMLPGSWARELDTQGADPNPLWLSSEAHPVAALAEAIQVSANSLWKHSARGNEKWRELFSLADKNTDRLTLSKQIVEHNLVANLVNMDNFWFADAAESADLVTLRETVTDRMTDVFANGFDPLLSQASQSAPYVREILDNVPIGFFADLEVVYYLQAEKEALVFLASSGGAHLSLCLTLHKKKDEWQTVSVDVIPYTLMLRASIDRGEQ